ncbi:MAG: phosphoglycerate mutase family protein [Acidimicrobiales bacterium]|nr:phosphoglycerate mutase family protein [Acidimicrobiales bacterium]
MTLWIVRHACAGHRSAWEGPDEERPLDVAGVQQARALATLLAAHDLDRLVSSPHKRCVDTLAPLAEATELPLAVDGALRPGDAAVGVLGDLLHDPGSDGSVVCTHGEVMAALLPALRAGSIRVVDDRSDDALLLKGAAWRIDRSAHPWLLELIAPIPRDPCPAHAEAD